MPSSTSDTLLAAQQLTHLRDALEQVVQQQMTPAHFSEQARNSAVLLQTLPPRFGEVLLNLLDRLEASALFTEESCSFSQQDLLDTLRQWSEKAQARLLDSQN